MRAKYYTSQPEKSPIKKGSSTSKDKFEWKIAKILEAQLVSPGKSQQPRFKYYITYLDENRRLDRWVQDTDIMQDQ